MEPIWGPFREPFGARLGTPYGTPPGWHVVYGVPRILYPIEEGCRAPSIWSPDGVSDEAPDGTPIGTPFGGVLTGYHDIVILMQNAILHRDPDLGSPETGLKGPKRDPIWAHSQPLWGRDETLMEPLWDPISWYMVGCTIWSPSGRTSRWPKRGSGGDREGSDGGHPMGIPRRTTHTPCDITGMGSG